MSLLSQCIAKSYLEDDAKEKDQGVDDLSKWRVQYFVNTGIQCDELKFLYAQQHLEFALH